jgi:diacylglycerol kinase family enzyme
MKIAPDARMDDGRFDVCIIEEVSKWELLKEFPKVFRGRHTDHPKVILKSGKRVEVVSEEKREIFADGEYVGNIPGIGSFGNKRIQVMRFQSGKALQEGKIK